MLLPALFVLITPLPPYVTCVDASGASLGVDSTLGEARRLAPGLVDGARHGVHVCGSRSSSWRLDVPTHAAYSYIGRQYSESYSRPRWETYYNPQLGMRERALLSPGQGFENRCLLTHDIRSSPRRPCARAE